MSNDDIEDIRARWAAVSPGPWTHEVDRPSDGAGWEVATTGVSEEDGGDGREVDHYVFTAPMPASELSGADVDAEAIAHAPEDVAWLLAEVERAHVERDAAIERMLDLDTRGAARQEPRCGECNSALWHRDNEDAAICDGCGEVLS